MKSWIFFQFYKEAEVLARQVYGDYAPLILGIHYNLGYTYEEQKESDYNSAYDYYRKSLVGHLEVYGEEHPETKVCRTTFGEPEYVKIAEERKDTFVIDLRIIEEGDQSEEEESGSDYEDEEEDVENKAGIAKGDDKSHSSKLCKIL